MMGRMVRKALIAAAMVYAAIVGLLFFAQERLIFPAPTLIGEPVIPPGFQGGEIETPDGERLFVLHRAPVAGMPTILIFHGNGDTALNQIGRAGALTTAGFGVVVAEYRGYPGSSGSPSQQGLVTDGLAAYDFAMTKYAGPIGVQAHSLGTGVAMQLAAQKPVFAMVLEAPFDSVENVAAARFPWAPVRMLLRHPFRSHDHIADLSMPILILHGDKDPVVPIAHGRALAAMGGSNVEFKTIAGASHNLFGHGSAAQAVAFFQQHRP